MVIVHNFKSLQVTFEARASEWFLAWISLNLALVLFFMDSQTFYGDSFLGMRDLIDSQLIWACLFLILGVLRFVVLIINGAYWRTPHFRALTAFLCAGLWFMLGIAFAQNMAIVVAVMPPLFFLDAYNVKRSSREAGTSEFIQRYKKQETSNAGMALEGGNT